MGWMWFPRKCEGQHQVELDPGVHNPPSRRLHHWRHHERNFMIAQSHYRVVRFVSYFQPALEHSRAADDTTFCVQLFADASVTVHVALERKRKNIAHVVKIRDCRDFLCCSTLMADHSLEDGRSVMKIICEKPHRKQPQLEG